METKDLFEKIILNHEKREIFLLSLEEEGYNKEFLDKVESTLEQDYTNYECIWCIDSYEEIDTKEEVHIISYKLKLSGSVSVHVNVMYVVPDNLTISNNK